MVASDIQDFSEGRTKARAYFCYLFSKNIPNRLPSLTIDMIMPRLLKIKADLEKCEGIYLLDNRGIQVTATYSASKQIDSDIGKIRADRAYYYRAVREERCTITDPYPSLITQELTVTASQPIFCEDGNLKYVACLDMPLDEVIKIAHMNTSDAFFSKLFKYSYAMFAFALIAVALLLFSHGIKSFFVNEITVSHLVIDDMFKATILLTLSLAIFDLAKTLIEEEILGRHKEPNISGPHKTMVKFLGSIIIALSIEALMLVFKFAITDPQMLLYSMYIIGGVAMLIVSLAIYIKFTKVKNDS
ncbi:membrane protein containing CACHE signaling domain [Sulfurimonas gotlandica GD1]|uniref:Membrane protein containing CACHE signaling domain n=1 Tax=Sulfurimonas gotlandica (strain DSM 19862 / JCM 16533 / GD1) TaxID=929558 RepID=B6BIK6_SULGG|nr:PDC sensor domain-containing protein [Sulfurimonas gotlandica]EDZ63674.1 general glycosylation pathway protein [Sulfurimonas gotlandica GD1]EHP30361.1 membrane protein containing CACHE signaling domain [Sulfurimonas gotlandica GD1]